MFRDELVSCYKDTAELVLFHDVKMKGHTRRGRFSVVLNVIDVHSIVFRD
jgi:hypothetical protein